VRARAVLPLLLAVAVLTVFWPALGHDFVNYDDDLYVTGNPWVQQGVTWASARWALTTDAAGNWHPLTWLSHQLDWTLWGPRPGGHHATSVVLHALNTVLLYAVLDAMTASPWRSALAAALFGLHPLHVESVAWIAERKDVLSTCLWLLTLLAYAGYVRRPGVGRYFLVMLGLALGLMAKPMVVTLPCTLLLLDYWPLGRWRRAHDLVPLVREKLPLFALVAISSVITWRVQTAAGAVIALPLANRLGHALVTYVAYLGKMLWPADLAAIYSHPGAEAPGAVLLSALVLALVTAAVVVERRRRPFLLVGWLWYLGTLVPVIGVVQVGVAAMADRFTYVPLVGIFVAIAWAVPAVREPRLVAAAAAVVLAVLAARARDQVRVWRDSATLFTHALAVDEANPLAHVNLAVVLDERGDLAGANAHLERALVLRPDMVTARIALGNNLVRRGRPEEAMAQYRAAIAADPTSARALNNLGWLQLQLGRLDEAIDSLERALRIDPGLATAENDLGMARARRGENDAARGHFERAVAANPRYADAQNNLAAILLSDGRIDEAVAHAESAIAVQPAFAEAHANRVVGLVRRGRYPDAWAAVRAARAAGVQLPDWLVSALAERMPDPGA
jgi:tetratricopeptide (TPR) repeat protein